MYKQFFRLAAEPFRTNPDPAYLYMMPQTREALAGLEHGISARKGFIVLTGEVGTGKTTLLRRAIEGLDTSEVATCYIFNPRIETNDLLEFILADFGIATERTSKSGMLMALNRWLIERFRRGGTCVLVVDEAQNLSSEVLEEIRLLTNLETSTEKLLQIVLSGQPELEAKLRESSLRQLRQRVALWCRLSPLHKEETAAYIVERLRIAGRTDTLFLPDAVSLIHRASRGIPRLINLICEHALILGYVQDAHTIDAAIIRSVARDLDLEPEVLAMASARNGVLSEELQGRSDR